MDFEGVNYVQVKEFQEQKKLNYKIYSKNIHNSKADFMRLKINRTYHLCVVYNALKSKKMYSLIMLNHGNLDPNDDLWCLQKLHLKPELSLQLGQEMISKIKEIHINEETMSKHVTNVVLSSKTKIPKLGYTHIQNTEIPVELEFVEFY